MKTKEKQVRTYATDIQEAHKKKKKERKKIKKDNWNSSWRRCCLGLVKSKKLRF